MSIFLGVGSRLRGCCFSILSCKAGATDTSLPYAGTMPANPLRAPVWLPLSCSTIFSARKPGQLAMVASRQAASSIAARTAVHFVFKMGISAPHRHGTESLKSMLILLSCFVRGKTVCNWSCRKFPEPPTRICKSEEWPTSFCRQDLPAFPRRAHVTPPSMVTLRWLSMSIVARYSCSSFTFTLASARLQRSGIQIRGKKSGA